jgi:putative spermidine/putrescine transport system substrate-binding protein
MTVRLTRRSVSRAGIASLLATPFVLRAEPAMAEETIVYVSAGGTTQEAQEKTILAAFQKETGIKVLSVAGADLAKMKAQQMSGNIEWDVINLQAGQAVFAATHDMLEKVDYSVVDASDSFMSPEESTLAWYVFTGGIGYRATSDAPKHPTDWPQFWDAKGLPGRRGLRSRPDETLEPALLADGVPARNLYPLDVDRAFRSLDRIKPYVPKWIAETQQTITLMQTNEVDFVYTYSGRVEVARQHGIQVEFVYNANLVTPSYLCVLKGTRHRAAAMKLVSYFLRPDLQAAFCNLTGYSPIRRAAIKLLTPETLAKQPKMDDPNTAYVDGHWWASNFDTVNQRYQEWLLS